MEVQTKLEAILICYRSSSDVKLRCGKGSEQCKVDIPPHSNVDVTLFYFYTMYFLSSNVYKVLQVQMFIEVKFKCIEY